MSAGVQRIELQPRWRRIDFISDLHLHEVDEDSFAAWCSYLRNHGADALFILGDLFEVWVGDDAARQPSAGGAQGFESRAAGALRAASSRCALFFMHGNRDFLVGPRLATDCRFQLIADPCVLPLPGGDWLLSHGDAMCLGDTDYLAFRAQVRSSGWQQDFLARPLDERRGIARALRARSEAHKAAQTRWYDVDPDAARSALLGANARTLLHGHTHRPGEHALGDGLRRIVLSDWDLRAQPPRAQVLRLTLSPGGEAPRLERLAPELA